MKRSGIPPICGMPDFHKEVVVPWQVFSVSLLLLFL
jgi:hypothetical protein